MTPPVPFPSRALRAWAFYDWANSAYPTVIVTFVFSAYFARGIAGDEAEGQALWGWGMAVSGLLIAVLGPIMGAVADQTGRRKPALGVFTALCVAATVPLWYADPRPESALWALAFVVLGNAAFEIAIVFYNAMLPELAPPERMGRWSGWAWGLGYAGGLTCLVICLFGLVQADPPPFGLDRSESEHVRAVVLVVAAWYAVFCLPLFLWVPDRPATGVSGMAAARGAIRELAATVVHLRRYREIARYLIAHMLYTDGLNTLFAFGSIYAAGEFGMDFAQIIMFGIAMNVSAGFGAFVFGWIDDWLGSKRTIAIGLVGMTAFGAALLVVTEVTLFWVFALPLGLFFGPVQAASRTFLARVAPPEVRGEMFGLYALSGKVTAFLGPATLAVVTTATGSQRWGMATILVFLVAGLWLLLTVKESAPVPRRR